MKYSFLILVSILFLACNPNERSISERTPNQLYPLKTAANHLTRFDDESLVWFFQLVEEGVEIPHEVIEKHTLISNSYGVFYGESMQKVNSHIKSIILRHNDENCIKHFVLTTDGKKIIDQQLISETCNRKEGESDYSYSEYVHLDPDFIGKLIYQVSEDKESVIKPVRKVGFRIMPEGNIKKITSHSVSL